MDHERIDGCTRTLGEAQGYRPLHVRDMVNLDDSVCMKSQWCPSAEELELLNKGGRIFLTVLGRSHPPVLLEVGRP
jgi:hypothetical protein